MPSVIFFIAGLIVGVVSVEAKHAWVTGPVAFNDVARCISMGP
jgi:hypothetical protein